MLPARVSIPKHQSKWSTNVKNSKMGNTKILEIVRRWLGENMAYQLSRKEQWIAETEDKLCCSV